MYYKKSLRIKNQRSKTVKHLWPLNLDYFLCPLWKLPTEKDGKRSQIPIPTEPPEQLKANAPCKIGHPQKESGLSPNHLFFGVRFV